MNDENDMVIYSSDLLTSQADQATGSHYNSFISHTGGASGSSLTQASCLNVQDLLDCVQKLKDENQQLSQIFFKDRRQREELISQLGEEFDQQVKEVEERANKRAREELEAEKRRLREMMLEEREQLQHHYKTIERMSNLVKNVYEERKRKNSDGLDENSSIEVVKSQLQDTYEENKQLKRSLLDTKTDVARIWKEMGNLKEKYEEQLSSAYVRNEQTKTECDHIKRQLSLMKDSNRKLQDASDVITSYINDKVEPVIKIAETQCVNPSTDEPQLYVNSKLLMTGNSSAYNSRRGSVLSDYIGAGDGDDDDETITKITLNIPEDDNDYEVNSYDYRNNKIHNCNDERSAQETCTTSRPITPTTNSVHPDNQKSTLTQAECDYRDISNWLAQPQNSTPSPEPRSAEILRRAGLTRDGLRASTSSSSSSGAPTINNDYNNLQQSYQSSTCIKNPQKTTLRGSRSRNLLGPQKSQSIDLQSDDLDETSLDGLRISKNVKAQGEKRDQQVGATQTANDLAVVSMVESADGPTVATYDIILVGDSFVGKSSLASRFIEGSYSKSVISTTSIDFKTKDCKVDGVNYTINLWDTAGQERFRSITASYFRKAKGIILMYDVTEKHTYLNIRNWMSTISNSAAESVAVLLLANKIDLREVKGIGNCIPKEEGERLAAEYGILFLETSVKSGTNLESSMANLIRQMVKNCALHDESQDSDRIKLDSRTRSSCMPKHC